MQPRPARRPLRPPADPDGGGGSARSRWPPSSPAWSSCRCCQDWAAGCLRHARPRGRQSTTSQH